MFIALRKHQIGQDFRSQTSTMGAHKDAPWLNTLSTGAEVAGMHRIFSCSWCSLTNRVNQELEQGGLALRGCANIWVLPSNRVW